MGRRATVVAGAVRIDTRCGEIVLGDEVFVEGGWIAGRLYVGDRTYIVGGMKLGGSAAHSLTIGSDCWIAPNVYACPASHHFKDRSRTITEQGVWGADIVIGDDCWIGANVVIQPGVTIGKGAVVGANAVVTKDVPEYTIVAGIPAREIGRRE